TSDASTVAQGGGLLAGDDRAGRPGPQLGPEEAGRATHLAGSPAQDPVRRSGRARAVLELAPLVLESTLRGLEDWAASLRDLLGRAVRAPDASPRLRRTVPVVDGRRPARAAGATDRSPRRCGTRSTGASRRTRCGGRGPRRWPRARRGR